MKGWRSALALALLAGSVGAMAAAPAPTTSQPARWTLVWADEFDGAAGSPPNPAYWQHEIGNAHNKGWGNHELQYYTGSTRNAALDGQGHLLIRAERQPGVGPCWNGSPCEYSSARLKTQGKVNFSQGKLEARIQIPGGQGIWPAFWTLGEGQEAWPAVGEIDVLEYVGKTPRSVYATVHGPGYSGAAGLGREHVFEGPVTGFHVYTLIKRPHELIWLIDDVEVHRVTPASLPKGSPWVFEKPFFLLLNLAVGGDWPGSPDATTPLPATMSVDWVRLYKED